MHTRCPPAPNPLGIVSIVFGSAALALQIVPWINWMYSFYFGGVGFLAGLAGLFLPRPRLSAGVGMVLSALGGGAAQFLFGCVLGSVSR